MGKKIISISIDDFTVVELDEIAHREGLSRSELVNAILSEKRGKWEIIAENRFLRHENARLKKWTKALEEVIARNRYQLNPEPLLVNELEVGPASGRRKKRSFSFGRLDLEEVAVWW